MPVDEIALNFTPSSLMVLNIILAIVMFGVALDLKTGDFRAVLDLPRSAIVGLTSQFLILPALTFLLSLLVAPTPSMALGMILVAACPGGNMSNFYTHLGKGNTPLSISMSAVSTAAAIFMTPLNLAFW
ncbi:MAG: bile acid:sodium symporter, partial [Anaerolineales bacterium]|nr:bile acid:sodium symporter [Anaerolineales bacterium]